MCLGNSGVNGMREKFNKFKWEVLITIIISCTSIFVAAKANDISKMQMLIARNAALPIIEVDEKVNDSAWPGYRESSIIEVSNLSGKMNNYHSEIVTFLRCGYFGSEPDSYEVIDIPIENYYLFNTKTGITDGVIEVKDSMGNYDKIKDLKKSILAFNKGNENEQIVDAHVLSYLKISYIDLLNEKQVMFYLIDPIEAKVIDSDYGQKQFDRYREMTAEKYGIDVNGCEEVLVEDVLSHILGTIEKGYIFEDINGLIIESKVDKLEWSWLINFICALFGGVCTLVGGVVVYKREKKNQESHAASMLYYDLKSIETYLRCERGSVNLRYTNNWQDTAANCSFLDDKDIEIIYGIYDMAYNYNYHYMLKEREGSVSKEDISTYKDLQKKMFNTSKDYPDFDKHSEAYGQLLNKLKRHIKA